ncbi:uncharacterized protein NECHADRAFT_83404 [Fusarium vanettenii 77-13-4]|uniref:BZIP domain-containing protein n=1 Tax=Fusarium vanettenii (strain ATCC MYA-4622 / CBS 123669 / FGSC 9596 / NRRL 45880 / 77-13-4) TaxID=660122 RepID=C7Z3X7_FUSV7|nr:uncharacterized protein NECHADRAFT_83404 [Fusarium vanettenii 77-13-4]EEU41380.1 hypothetical protein NECHADRAFT_83404 [Fusarium vanettenii 77-13-4]
MNSSNSFADESTQFGNNYMLAATGDANIDPMLNACTTEDPIPPSRPMGTQFMMNPAMWNPALNNPVGFFPPELSTVVPTTSTGSPRPPTEAQSSPGTISSEPVFETSRTSSKSSIPSINSIASETNTKTRKSTRSTNSHRRRASAASPPRRPAAKEPVVEEEEEEEDMDDHQSSKRSKFLKRNRIAASKCRQKKKEWVNNLEETRSELEHQHSTLQTEYNDLLGEVSKMKNQLMQHAGCNDSNINQWIENEARKFVQRTAAEYHTGQAHCSESEINYDHMPDDMLD